jgi:hypothetical protein
MEKYIHYLELFAQVIGGVCVLATIVVRITPSPKDDEIVHGFTKYFYKFLHFLPTIGVNPQTKKLEEAIEEAKQK